MIFKKAVLIGMVFGALALMMACTQAGATPVTIVETIVIKETVPVEKVVEVVVTQQIEKEVEKVVTVPVEKKVRVIETVEVEKIIPLVETVEVIRYVKVEVAATPTPTPSPTLDLTHPGVNEVLNQITLVQHHRDRELGFDWFTCASRGQGLNGVEVDPAGPRFVGPNSMDFDLWGVVALFKVCPDGCIFLVPQQTGGWFVDPDGIEHRSFTLAEALGFFASGDALWIGAHGEAGRIGECDPQYVTPTPTPD
jgi:hypothetical protein